VEKMEWNIERVIEECRLDNGNLDETQLRKGLDELSKNNLNTLEGMTLRDYFAGLAIVGDVTSEMPTDIVAKYAYQLADAMMKERQA